MKLKWLAISTIVVGTLLISEFAFAELDPELAELSAENRNQSQGFAAANLSFGQANAAGDRSPGLGLLAGGELGWIVPRGSWSRIEWGFEASTGTLNFEDNDGGLDHDTTLLLMVLAKFGYGYSLGDGIFGVWRVGVGPYFGNYEASTTGVDVEGDNPFMGLAARLGFDVVVPVSETLDWTAGIRWTHIQLDVDDIEVNGVSQPQGAEDTFSINMPALALGVRFRL